MAWLALLPSGTAKAFGGCSCSAEPVQAQPDTAEYAEGHRPVIEALTSVLVERGELSAETASSIRASAIAVVEDGRAARITSQSIEQSPEALGELVVEDHRRWVTEAGGRYVLSISVERIEGGGTRVAVASTLVASVPEAEAPLGGRALRSNGSLEAAVLEALSRRLAGEG